MTAIATNTPKGFTKRSVEKETLKKAFELMCTAKAMAELYEQNKEITAKYVQGQFG